MADHHTSVGVPTTTGISTAGMDVAAFIRKKVICDPCCLPSAEVVLQSYSSTVSKSGYLEFESTEGETIERVYKEQLREDHSLSQPPSAIISSTVEVNILRIDRGTSQYVYGWSADYAYYWDNRSTGNCTDGEGNSTPTQLGLVITGSGSGSGGADPLGYSITGNSNPAKYIQSTTHVTYSCEGTETETFNFEVSALASDNLIGMVVRSPTLRSTDVNYTVDGGRAHSLRSEFTTSELKALAVSEISPAYLSIKTAYSAAANFSARVVRRTSETTASYTTLKQDRIDLAATVLVSVQNALANAEASLAEKTNELTTAESDLLSAQGEVDSIGNSLNDARQALADKESDLYSVKNRLAYVTLTDEQRTQLESEESTLEGQRDTLYADYVSLRNDLNAKISEVNTLDTDILTLKREAAELGDEVVIRNANITEVQKFVTAAATNTDVVYYEYSASGGQVASYSLTSGERTVTVSKSRYRVRVPLDGYHIPDTGLTLTLKWRERTYQHEERSQDESEEDTASYVDKQEVVTAMPGDYEASSQFNEVPLPSVHHTVSVVGVKTTSTLSIAAAAQQGGTWNKVGIFAYTPSATPGIHKKETFTGGIAPRSYSGVREAVEDGDSESVQITTAFSSDLIAAYGDAAWPGDFELQPAIGNESGGVVNVQAKKHPRPYSESETVRVFRRLVNGSEETLVSTLSNEYTTAALKGKIDNLIGDNWTAPILGSLPSNSNTPISSSFSERWLSGDETRYRRIRYRFKLRLNLPTSFDEAHSESATYKEHTLNVQTGVLTTVTRTVSFSFDAGENSKTQEDWTILEAGDNELKWIDNLRGSEADAYEGDIQVTADSPPDFLGLE